MKFYTIGYGGRKPQDFVDLLVLHGIAAIVDVRLRPDRANMGSYVKAKSPDRGIQGLLQKGSVQYFSLTELGNPFMHQDEWRDLYARHLAELGDGLFAGLKDIPQPFCLMCAEKRVSECHRELLANYLAKQGWEFEHIE